MPRNLVLSEAAELAFPKKSFMEMSVAPRFLTHQGQPAQPSQALRLPGSSMPPFRCGLPSQTFVSVQRKGVVLPIFGKIVPWVCPIATAQWVIIFYRPSDWKWDNHPTTSAMVPLQPLKQKRHKEPMNLLWWACGNGFHVLDDNHSNNMQEGLYSQSITKPSRRGSIDMVAAVRYH